MRILAITATLLFCAWVIHLIIWRIRLPKHQLRALLLIFAGTFVAGLFGLAALNLTPPEIAHFTLFYTAVALCYVITYSAIEGDSPTLSLMRLLSEHGADGLPTGDVTAFLEKRPFVRARLAALMHSGLVQIVDDRYRVVGQESLSFRVILGFRRLYGPISKGG